MMFQEGLKVQAEVDLSVRDVLIAEADLRIRVDLIAAYYHHRPHSIWLVNCQSSSASSA